MEHSTEILWPKRSSEQNELITALCKAQAELPIVDKNKSGRFKYADFPQVIFMTRPILTKYGLAVTQDFVASSDGGNFILTTLAHISGQWRESIYALPRRGFDLLEKGQSMNAAAGGDITYYKRYTYCAIIGCATSDEDYDGEAALTDTRGRYSVTISPAQAGLLRSVIGKDTKMIAAILQKESIKDLSELHKDKFAMWLDKVRHAKEAQKNQPDSIAF